MRGRSSGEVEGEGVLDELAAGAGRGGWSVEEEDVSVGQERLAGEDEEVGSGEEDILRGSEDKFLVEEAQEGAQRGC